ncbi:MAG: type IV secretory system conjugative DNA transfer family protein [Bacteroidota bacterium]
MIYFILISSSTVFASDKDEILSEIINEPEKYAQESYSNEFADLRPKSIIQAAQTIGFQKGVEWRYNQIIKNVEKNESDINRIFDFGQLTMDNGRLLPPVIVEGNKGVNIESRDTSTEVEVSYRILKDARIISVPPTWRDYLYYEYKASEVINPAVLPKNDEEQEIWEKHVASYFQRGIEHADRIFQRNLNKMTRDFKGILSFKILAEQNMVSLPILSEGKVGVVVEDKTLDVDQRVFRITKDGTFNNKVDTWTPKIGNQILN